MAEDPQKTASAEEVVLVPAESLPTTHPELKSETIQLLEDKISQSVSFKEETNVVADLPDAHKKALDDLKKLVLEALNNHDLTAPKPEPENKKDLQVTAAEAEKKEVEVTAAEAEKEEVEVTAAEAEKKEVEVAAAEAEKEEVEVAAAEAEKEEIEVREEVTEEKGAEEVEIWGIPLMADERSDVILLKFLRARDFKVKEALNMIRNTVRWRKEFGIEELLVEDLGSDWEKVVFTHGYDKEGHPVYYNVFGEFEDKELYNKSFGDEEKRNKFIRWRIQSLEKSVRRLDFSPTSISTIVQVNDLKNSPGLGKRELRNATNQALELLQDNYPEFVAKQIFINVPWWYLAFSRMISPFLTQRTKSKFLFAGPSKSAETLFKYIAPELVPVQYGGLSREGEQEFTTADPATEVTIKPATKHVVEFPVSEKSHIVWEIRVVGWDVNYGAEFVPSAEDGYTVIVQKNRKIGPADETVITNAFKIGEAGKILLTIDNQTSKKKKLLYRSKTKSNLE